MKDDKALKQLRCLSQEAVSRLHNLPITGSVKLRRSLTMYSISSASAVFLLTLIPLRKSSKTPSTQF